MVNNSFGDHQGVCRVGKKAAHHALQGIQLRGELGGSFGVSVKPFLDEVDLVTEVMGRCAKCWGVEGGFFETNWTIKKK
ncbi:hypothetical protein VI817_006777 [Penicillium citrinum]|nr:hypothetical protein VI817_006777 [Penicillium citrinum]